MSTEDVETCQREGHLEPDEDGRCPRCGWKITKGGSS